MTKKIKMKCPECQTEFEFDPTLNAKVLTSLNESYVHRQLQTKEVVIYLTCPKGHTKPYTITKEY